jgi:integrase
MKRQQKRSAFGRVFQREGRLGYYVRVRYKGREIVRYAGTDRRTAAEYQAQLLRRLTREDLLGERTLASVTFAEFEPMLLQSLRARHARTTYCAEVGRVKRVREHFGGTPLKDIGPADIESFLAGLRNEHGFSIAAANRYASLLSVAFKLAVHKGFAAMNPVKEVARAKEPQRPVPFLSSEDVASLLAATRDERFAVLLRILADTGLRRSEALALEWTDIDFARRCVLVRESKNRRPRQVELTDAALHALRSLAAQRTVTSSAERSFVWPEWQRRGPQGVSSRFKTVARRAGHPTLRLHDLRHGFCSRLAQAGVPLPTIAALAGHTSWLTTQRYASHLPEGATRDAIAALQRKEQEKTANAPRAS